MNVKREAAYLHADNLRAFAFVVVLYVGGAFLKFHTEFLRGRRLWPRKGGYLYDVRIGGPPKRDVVRKLSKGGCVNLQTSGRRGSKNPKLARTSFKYRPRHTMRRAASLLTICMRRGRGEY